MCALREFLLGLCLDFLLSLEDKGEGVNFYIKFWVDITVVISFIVGRTYGGTTRQGGYTEEPR